jgi:hypothetical protein
MHDTPVPEARLELERLRLAAALQRARRTLVARPAASAPEVAQGALFPLLHALGVDIFDLSTLRLAKEPSPELAVYSLRLGVSAEISMVAADASLPAVTVNGDPRADRAGLAIASNGRHWKAVSDGRSAALDFELFEPGFPEALAALITALIAGESSADGLDRAREALQVNRLTDSVERLIERTGADRVRNAAADPAALEGSLRREGLLGANEHLPKGYELARERLEEVLESGEKRPGRGGPLARIGIDEVRHHAEQVRSMRGKLEARFEGKTVEISSRTAYYFLLAALALNHGREDAIPPEDLVRPPDTPPAGRHARPLGRPGWYLLLDHVPDVVERHTSMLLDVLGLRRHFSATQRGEEYPKID